MSQWNRREPLDRDPANGRATALHRAQGLGSAKTGVEHWWLQRLTAVALVPLLLWFLAELIAHAGADHATTAAWLAQPLTAVVTILLVVALFQHLRLGLQVVIEDYVHVDRLKFVLVAAVHGGCYVLMAAGVFAVLLIALR